MKTTFLILILLLPLFVIAENISLDIPLPQDVSKFETGDFGSLGLGTISSPGTAQLPVKSINVLLPPGAELVSWQITLSAAISVAGKAPKRNSAFSNGDRILSSDIRKDSISPYSFLGLRKWGDLNYAAFYVLPATWNGEAWQISSSCQVSVDYSVVSTSSNRIPPTFMEHSFFANPQDMDRWYARSSDRNYDVLVISTPALYAQLATWVSFRESQGLVVTFTDIATALSTGIGGTEEAKLRSYLRNEYLGNSFSYLLLVGDYNTVPTAFLTPEPDGFETVPSDFFFSDLSSNWDSDNDGKLGEYSTGFMNQDYEVDFTPEVFVGRISTNSSSQVANIASRIVAFEQSSAAWKNKNLFPAAYSNYNGEPEPLMPATDSATYSEFCINTILQDQPNTTLYEQLGVVPSYPSNYPLSYEALQQLLNTESWGFVNWSAHGSSSSSARKIWIQDYDLDNIPDSEEMTWMNLVNRQSFDNLTNTDGTVIFAASCYNGMIDSDNASLAEYALIKKAVGVIGATRTGWYKVGWLNPGWGGLSSYNYHFVENYRQNKTSLGAAHAYTNLLHSQFYMFGDPIDAGGIIYPELQNIYTYLLYGDPLVGYTPDANLPNGEILVWEPNGNSGLPVVNALRQSTGMNVIYSDKLITDYNYLSNFEAVFCLFGQSDASFPTPQSFEYGYLNSYLAGGGKLYLEPWIAQDPTDDFWTKFGTNAPYPGVAHIESIVHPVSENIWQYAYPDNSVSILEPNSANAHTIFIAPGNELTDSNVAIWNTNGNYRTVTASFNLCGVLGEDNNLTDMIRIICDTLNVNTLNPVSNQDPESTPAMNIFSIYPNPGKGFANIQISLSKNEPVEIEVYNMRGQKVKTLIQSIMSKGEHQILWDGKDEGNRKCSSGVYFMKLRTGSELQCKKLLLLQ
ncbi:MAG: C25 family cysteine peptidase [Candidatus Cloacimonetes bacterium]|nr:C25 family cysteine peptidase [Candidatus Cloacimonadota bacterium]